MLSDPGSAVGLIAFAVVSLWIAAEGLRMIRRGRVGEGTLMLGTGLTLLGVIGLALVIPPAQMARAADTKISALPAASAAALADQFEINKAGTSNRLTLQQALDGVDLLADSAALADADKVLVIQSSVAKDATLTNLKAWAGNMLRNQSTADQSPAAGGSTYLTNSSISVPVGKLRIGTTFRWTLVFTKTAAGTAARSHIIRIGTNGTTADAAIVTLTSGTPTAATDTGHQVITAIVRGPLSASCILHGASRAIHQVSTTGLFANETEVLQVASGTWDCTTANLIVGLSVTTGASEALTYQQVIVEAFNL